jgi:hypothetical protein
MLTFIAEYPNDGNIRDGMMIRIKEIDEKHAHIERCYLDISLFRPRKNKGKPTVVSDKLSIYHLNFFLDILLIYRLLFSAKQVYVQTLFNYVKVLPFLHLFFPETLVALDLHGVIPEELSFQKSRKQSVFYAWVEQAAFKRVNCFIHVTRSMKNHFLEKYPSKYRQATFKDIVLGIFTTYDAPLDEEQLSNVKQELNWEENQVWFIYSGGIQSWQNIPLVLKTMSDLNNAHYRFLILTGQPQVVLNWIEEQKIIANKIIVKSVSPHQLKEYYTLSNYGFVLRNPDIVNKVSNPTKLSEYLAYGMVPIVLDPNIGDYLEMGFEYLSINNINNQLIGGDSDHNRAIYKKYISEMELVKLPFI